MSIEEPTLDPEEIADLLNQAQANDLTPVSPEEALRMYLELREDDAADGTIRTHKSRLSFFVEWCTQNEIDNLNDLTGKDLFDYRNWRKQQLNSTKSLEANLRTVRVFLRKCVQFDAVPPNLPEKIDVPTIADADAARDDLIDSGYAQQVIDHLAKFEYASSEHVVWVLLTEVGIRISALYAADTTDYERRSEDAVLHLRHRPTTGTPLKNKSDSERPVSLRESAAVVINDYLDNVRPDVVDDEGRSPLLTSDHGRLQKSTMRKYVYKWTRPCVITGDCPHGKDPEDPDSCPALQNASQAYKCDSSSSPHAIRRGYITAELDTGVPAEVLSDRCDVSTEVIATSYDKRDPNQKLRLRKELREAIYEDTGNGGYARD